MHRAKNLATEACYSFSSNCPVSQKQPPYLGNLCAIHVFNGSRKSALTALLSTALFFQMAPGHNLIN